MKNLKVSTKLVVGFLVVVLMAVFIGGFGIYGLTSMGNAADVMYSQKALPLSDLTKATEYFLRCRIQARSAILYTGNAEKLKPIESDVTDCLSQFEAEMEKYKPSIQTDKGAELFDNIINNYATFKPAIHKVLSDAKQGNSQEDLLNELGTTLDSTNAISNSLSELVQARMNVMGTANEENLSLKNILLTIIIAIIVVVVGSSMILVYYISGLITKPLSILTVFMNKAAQTGEIILNQSEMESVEKFAKIKDEIGQCIASTTSFITHIVRVGKVLESVADGDLTAELATLSDKDTMGLSLQKMVRNLSKMFAEINSSTMQVATAAKQIANGSQSLAQGSTEQASAVEQLSCSIAEIAQKTKDNATLALSASELGNTIKSNAEKGSTQMEHMVQAVKDIGESSRSIGKIIKLIDDIAFQTNILALNAAVEAARAGQHGKGFAIVAEEVRSLASKSAEAAKNTGSLITDSIEKTELGVSIATETAGSLAEIVSGINENSRIVEEIAESSKEQTTAIDQINKGIEQVAQVVAQNSGTAEESAAASEEMSGQAAVLGELVAQFKIR